MNTEVLNKVKDKYTKNIPELNVGDFVEVETIIRDGDKQRIQKFKGMIIAIKGKGLDKTITVRKISYGVGVEKILPIYSTNVNSIKVIKHSKVRRSKLYYMRDRVGKSAMKLKAGQKVVIEDESPMVEEESEEITESVETTQE